VQTDPSCGVDPSKPDLLANELSDIFTALVTSWKNTGILESTVPLNATDAYTPIMDTGNLTIENFVTVNSEPSYSTNGIAFSLTSSKPIQLYYAVVAETSVPAGTTCASVMQGTQANIGYGSAYLSSQTMNFVVSPSTTAAYSTTYTVEICATYFIPNAQVAISDVYGLTSFTTPANPNKNTSAGWIGYSFGLLVTLLLLLI